MRSALLVTVLLWSFSTASHANQTVPLPTVEGRINFTEVVLVDGATKDALYARAKVWFADALSHPITFCSWTTGTMESL